MSTAGAILPTVMRTRDGEMHDYPDHANVLAVVRAYSKTSGPMPYALLLEVMESLEAVRNDMAIHTGGATSVAVALHNVVTDLRRLDLVDLGSSGTVLTPAGVEKANAWNGQFEKRSEQAAAALRDLGFLPE
jgi:hypothetical protein